MKNKLLPVITFAKIDIKRLFRDKVGIFFVFVFPLIFLFVFGGIFGRNQEVSFNIALLNQAETEFATNFQQQLTDSDLFEVDQEITNFEQAREQIVRGSIDAIVTLPGDFGAVDEAAGYPAGRLEVAYDQGSQQAGSALSSALESILADINAELVDTPEPFTVTATTIDAEGLSQFDYLFSGLLGFTILSLGVFGPTSVFPRMKERGVLRRYHTTPIRVWQYFAANVLSNATIGLMAIALMIAAAMAVFNLEMRGDYLSLAILAMFGTVVLFGVGLAVGGWAKNENQAAPLGNLVAFPMMFLSGVFFPRFLMPDWLQTISGFLPLTPLIDGFRFVITEGQTLLQIGPQLLMLAGWLVVIYAIAFRVFRWE